MGIPAGIVIEAVRARRMLVVASIRAEREIGLALEQGNSLLQKLATGKITRAALHEDLIALRGSVPLALESTGLASEAAILARLERVTTITAQAHRHMNSVAAAVRDLTINFRNEVFRASMVDLKKAHQLNKEAVGILQGMVKNGEIPGAARAILATDELIFEAIAAEQRVVTAAHELDMARKLSSSAEMGAQFGSSDPMRYEAAFDRAQKLIAQKQAAFETAKLEALEKMGEVRVATANEGRLLNSVVAAPLMNNGNNSEDDFRPLKDNELPNSTMYTRRATRSAMELADTSINLNRVRSDIEDNKAIDASLVRSKRLDSVFDTAAAGTTPSPTKGPSL